MTSVPDLVEQLLHDHWMFERLLDRLEEEEDPHSVRHLLLDLGELLACHEAVEQELVFPLVGDEATAGRQDEHQEINLLVHEMGGLATPGLPFRKRACALALQLRAHLRVEEETVLPALRELVSPDDLAVLGERAWEVRRWAPALPALSC